MAHHLDIGAKLLLRYSRGVIARLLFGGQVVEWLNVELPAVRNPRVDLLARMDHGGLRHVELQTQNDLTLPRRKAEYYLGFWRLLDEHVTQVMLYMGREPLRTPHVWTTPALTYEFTIFNLREMDGEPLLASDDWGDNVLALLARCDQERVIRAVEAQIRRLAGQEQADALQTFVILSGILGMEEQLKRRLRRDMIDLMENKIIGPAIRQGIDQGLTQGRHEGMETVLRDLLEVRFGKLPAWASERIASAGSDQLRDWCRRHAQAESLASLLGTP